MAVSRDVYESSAILNSLIPFHSSRSPIFLSDFYKFGLSRQISMQVPTIESHRKLSSGYFRADERTDVKLTVSFPAYANAHKDHCLYFDLNPNTTFVQRLAQSHF
jgi:hypothetical protein